MKIFFLSISLFSFIILSGCAAKQSVPTSVSVQTPSSTAVSTDEGGEGEMDTSDWKVYENKSLGFKMLYPSNLISHFDDNQNDFGVATGFNLQDDRGVFISVTNLRKRELMLEQSSYDFSTDHIRFDVEGERNDFLSASIKFNPDTIICGEEFQKRIGKYNYHLVLSCTTREGLYTRLGYTLFKDDYYVSAWIDVDDFLKEDALIRTTSVDAIEDVKRPISNPEKGKKTGEAIELLESILSNIVFT